MRLRFYFKSISGLLRVEEVDIDQMQAERVLLTIRPNEQLIKIERIKNL